MHYYSIKADFHYATPARVAQILFVCLFEVILRQKRSAHKIESKNKDFLCDLRAIKSS